ncbi:MAG: proline--tRNA ligase [Bacilli bacterium]|nr:proline--tRNA ligase [Bacilli bacterium]MDD3422031.1 proline--tRNA ligase [Bacilli bacterium]MDD4065649.1 proline--tRNA ligase [Bacilli bacterium]
MKLKNSFFFTFREASKDEDSLSGRLLTQAGMIKKTSAGVYMYLPLGFKVLANMNEIIREEMVRAGSQEVLMPALVNEDVYIASGRRAGFGHDMFTLKDRFNKAYALGPTHEELFVMAAKMKIKSYKDLPFNIFQMQTKFRDEPRPRYGLIRVREFEMKDAYSFDADLAGLEISYRKMYDAYVRIFDRMGFNYAIVRADTGVMGGLLSEEFQALTGIGEDTIVTCDSCKYSANLEIAECVNDEPVSNEKPLPFEEVATPNAKTIQEVSDFLHLPSSKFVKTLIYKIDDKFYALLLRGDREVNETKVKKLLGALEIELATPEDVVRITKAKVGFAGPVGLSIPVIMDNRVANMKNFIVGANKTDCHLKNVNLSDFKVFNTSDISQIKEGDKCPQCGGTIKFSKGIEIGNTFKLGTKYSHALGLQFLDKNGKLQDVEMGSYGIGVGRCLSALVEQNHDERGIIWPMSVAPYKVTLVLINLKDEKQVSVANQIYDELMKKGIEPLFDDRDERAGVKFNDCDLIGIPLRVTIGKGVTDGNVEFKHRKDEKAIEVPIKEIVDFIVNECQK